MTSFTSPPDLLPGFSDPLVRGFQHTSITTKKKGILTATEREVVRPNGIAAMAFRDFASQAANTLDAHSLGALGARNLMGMGFVRARVRMFGRPALSLGWTEKAHNMCMVSVVMSPLTLPSLFAFPLIVPFFFRAWELWRLVESVWMLSCVRCRC